MEEEILKSLMLRQGISDETLVRDLIQDCISDMRSYLNYKDGEELPDGCIPAVKEMVLIRYNHDGVEGIASESQSSGGNTVYMDNLPDKVGRTIRRYRRFKR